MDHHFFKRRFSKICVLALLTFGWASLQAVRAALSTDDYVRDYASAVIAKKYPASVEFIKMNRGVVYLQGNGNSLSKINVVCQKNMIG